MTRLFQTKFVPSAPCNACDYVIQSNFVIAHIPGAQNTAAGYLSRMEADPKDKLVMKISEDVQTVPTEKNVYSAGVSQEEQIFYTNDDDETEEQYWARKEAIRMNPATEEPAVTIQTLSTNLVKQQPEIKVRLRKTNQITIEQSKDAVLQKLKVKLLHEEYSETVLQQDARLDHLDPLLNHNTSFHASIGCEPTRVFRGRIPNNILDHKLGNNPNKQTTPTTEFAESNKTPN